ncbi:hypothetical protein P691DRAFT_767411 [Macrolepiota fuliginosa MF-IS2]|uniref:Uncharacterized protein n=1 Tax=Macrolepiota fuliginosa MF-IS2 TaxID=1400762 RepID=A0A9P6BVD2_9AGAR|nr:hypothetical protein P691DRAFT_767411 [Macrolepiota fuliginosa MF-IS2]
MTTTPPNVQPTIQTVLDQASRLNGSTDPLQLTDVPDEWLKAFIINPNYYANLLRFIPANDPTSAAAFVAYASIYQEIIQYQQMFLLAKQKLINVKLYTNLTHLPDVKP